MTQRMVPPEMERSEPSSSEPSSSEAGSRALGSRPHTRYLAASLGRARSFTISRRSSHNLKFERVLFLSDAVFAIALTLLVLDLRVPDAASGGQMEQTIRDLLRVPGPFLAFVIGFIVITAYWTSHREIFGAVGRMNGRLIWLNFAFLFWIALQPFASAILGSHDPAPTSVLAYALVQIATGLTQAALWMYATGSTGLSWAEIDERFRRWISVELLRVPAVFLVSIPVALVAGPVPAMASWLLIVPASVLIHRHYRDAVGRLADDSAVIGGSYGVIGETRQRG